MKFFERKDKRKGLFWQGNAKGWLINIYPVLQDKVVKSWYFTLTTSKGYKYFKDAKDFTSVEYRSLDKCMRVAEKEAKRQYKEYVQLPVKAFIAYACEDNKTKDRAMIVFAQTAVKARKVLFNTGLFENYLKISVKRCLWADKYIKQGKVPESAWLEQGFEKGDWDEL